MQDYWHQNHWFAKTFRAGTRALAAADKGPLSPPRSAAASIPLAERGAGHTVLDGEAPRSASGTNGDPSERANGLADRRGSAPGLEITTDKEKFDRRINVQLRIKGV